MQKLWESCLKLLASRSALYLSIVLATLLMVSCTQPSSKRPNVVVILVDDLGYSDLGFSGSTFHETPHLDLLAQESWKFSQGYSGSRVCSPSRATLLTGQFTARHGITDWIGASSGEQWREAGRHDRMLPAAYHHSLSHDHTTMAEAFKSQGYRTFYSGKWHLGGEGSFPEDHGFDYNVGGFDKGSPVGGFFSPYQNPKMEDGPAGENLEYRLAKEVAEFVSKDEVAPFFVMLSFYAVHSPLQTTQQKWQKYRDKAIAKGVADRGFEMKDRLPHRTVQDNPVYAGLVESVDDAVGLVIRELKEKKLYDNTIIVFTSDNGGVVAGDDFATNNLVVRGGKGQHWEGGIRVPFLIRAPATGKSATIDYPVTSADVFPTLLDLCGLPLLPLQHMDGASLKPLMEGFKLPERSLFWHYPHYGNQGGVPSSVIRKGPWKLIHYWEDNHQELYNLLEDPQETKNVIADFPQEKLLLSIELNNYLEENRAQLPTPDGQFNPESYAERIQNLESRLLPSLEARRKAMFEADWKPNEDWWGSMPLTVD